MLQLQPLRAVLSVALAGQRRNLKIGAKSHPCLHSGQGVADMTGSNQQQRCDAKHTKQDKEVSAQKLQYNTRLRQPCDVVGFDRLDRPVGIPRDLFSQAGHSAGHISLNWASLPTM